MADDKNIQNAAFQVDVPFTKAAQSEAGDLKLVGYASTWTLDRDREYVAKDAFDGTLTTFMKANPILLWQHDHQKPLGTIETAVVDEYGLAVKAIVPKPTEHEPDWAHLAYNKIRSGVVRTFSIGGNFHREMTREGRRIKSAELYEVSVVAVPANPDSIFTAAAKSVEGGLRPEMHQVHVQQMAQLLGVKSITDPELAVMSDEEKRERYDELNGYYRKAGKIAPGYDSWREIKPEDQVYERLGSVLKVFDNLYGRSNIPAEEDGGPESGVKLLHEAVAEVKAGRVLSRANEAKIRQMIALGNELVAMLDKQTNGDGEESDDGGSDGEPSTTIHREAS